MIFISCDFIDSHQSFVNDASACLRVRHTQVKTLPAGTSVADLRPSITIKTPLAPAGRQFECSRSGSLDLVLVRWTIYWLFRSIRNTRGFPKPILKALSCPPNSQC